MTFISNIFRIVVIVVVVVVVMCFQVLKIKMHSFKNEEVYRNTVDIKAY
jgi:uncharacterized membrane protein